MRKLLLAGLILCSGFLNAQLTAIKCGKLIDGKNEQPLLNKAILIEGNMIKDIVEQTAIPRNAIVIDLNNKTVLPGLIDCHTHVLLQGDITAEDYAEQLLKESIPYRTLRASVACKIALMNGFTTIRDLGTEGAMADIIAVDGDPLLDIKLLEKVSFVMKNGKVVK